MTVRMRHSSVCYFFLLMNKLILPGILYHLSQGMYLIHISIVGKELKQTHCLHLQVAWRINTLFTPAHCFSF